MSERLEDRITIAKRGRELWLKIVEHYDIKSSNYVVILPSTEALYNEPAITELPRFLRKRGIKKAFVFTSDEDVLARQISAEDVEILLIKQEASELKALVQLYNLYEYAPNVIIASLEEPSGRMGKQLIGKKNLTSDEVFAGIVYSLVD